MHVMSDVPAKRHSGDEMVEFGQFLLIDAAMENN